MTQPFLHRLAAGTALALVCATAGADVLSFDDLVGADGYAAIPAGYGGLDWSAGGWSVFTGEQSPYTPHSGAGRVTMGFGSEDAASTIRFATPTVLDGAWFAGYAEATVRFDLYRDGRLVANSSVLTLSATPAFLSTGWTGAIDAVVVSSPMQALYAMDDLSFHAVAAVPEPSTVALMLAGLGLVGAVARRRR